MSLKSMKGVLLNGHGGFDKLEYKENIPMLNRNIELITALVILIFPAGIGLFGRLILSVLISKISFKIFEPAKKTPIANNE